MWTEIVIVGIALVGGLAIGVILGVIFKGWLISRAQSAQSKFDAAVSRAVAELTKTEKFK